MAHCRNDSFMCLIYGCSEQPCRGNPHLEGLHFIYYSETWVGDNACSAECPLEGGSIGFVDREVPYLDSRVFAVHLLLHSILFEPVKHASTCVLFQ